MGAFAAGGGSKKSFSAQEEEVADLALRLGVAPRRLLGWEPAEVTTHVYEGDRLVRSVTVREPEWSQSDVALVQGRVDDELLPRGEHGVPLVVAMDRLGDPSSAAREWDWVVPLPAIDFAQQELDRTRSAYAKKYPDADLGALRWRVEKRDR